MMATMQTLPKPNPISPPSPPPSATTWTNARTPSASMGAPYRGGWQTRSGLTSSCLASPPPPKGTPQSASSEESATLGNGSKPPGGRRHEPTDAHTPRNGPAHVASAPLQGAPGRRRHPRAYHLDRGRAGRGVQLEPSRRRDP